MFARTRAGRRRLGAVGSLVVLSAIGAELLAAYNDTTGRPAALLGNLVFFALLYGCPALLLRELARRTGRGWPTIVALSAAAGLLQAGVIDQSLFAERYDEVRGWEESFRATAIAPLGISAYMLQSFVLGHVVYSFCAPIAVVEGLFPSISRRPWLGRRGIVVAATLWALVAAAIVADARYATLPEAAGACVLVVVLVVAALRVGRGEPSPEAGSAGVGVAVGFVAATAHAVLPAGWPGTVAAVLVALAAGAALGRVRHAAALATGALLSRGVLAFTYFPVVGETPAPAKYAHNVVMLAIVAAAGFFASGGPFGAEARHTRPRVRSSGRGGA